MTAQKIDGAESGANPDVTSVGRLVPMTYAKIGSVLLPTVSMRDLHAFLEVRKDFSNWIKGRIARYGFQEGSDYVTDLFANLGEKGQGRPTVEYHGTLDMAKELGMVENSARGRQVRRYFIECERTAMAAHMAPPPATQQVIEPRPWSERPSEERSVELRTIATIGRYGNHALAWWYMAEVARVAKFPRHLLPAWHQADMGFGESQGALTISASFVRGERH